jgi:hypothetical protein
MPNSLATPTDLSGFPGAPFSEALVDAAVGSVRGEVSWHIAPQVTETLTVDGTGGQWLFLPTLYLVDVTAVRDITGDTPTVLDGWRKRRSGVLYRATGWPFAVEGIEVDVVHGHAETPPELLPVIADTARTLQRGGRVTQESLGSRSASLTGNPAAAVLARFKIPPRP